MEPFKLCTKINECDEKQCCQQLAVSLRGRTQAVYVTLSEEDKTNYKKLLVALEKTMTPPAFRQRKRQKGENLVDLVTNLRKLAARAYPEKDQSFVEEEVLEQFISAFYEWKIFSPSKVNTETQHQSIWPTLLTRPLVSIQ